MKAIGFRRLALVGALSAAAIAVPTAQAVRGAAAPKLPAQKQSIKDRLDRLRADALSAPRPLKDPRFRPAEAAAEPAWLEGIIASGQAPYPPELYVFVNQWQSVIGAEHANVYAGAERRDPSQGVVAVDYTPISIEGIADEGGVYAAPAATGTLRIVSVTAGVLTLESLDGTRFAFDLATRGFTIL